MHPPSRNSSIFVRCPRLRLYEGEGYSSTESASSSSWVAKCHLRLPDSISRCWVPKPWSITQPGGTRHLGRQAQPCTVERCLSLEIHMPTRKRPPLQLANSVSRSLKSESAIERYMGAFENGAVTEDMFGGRVRPLSEQAAAFRAREARLLAAAGAGDEPLPTPDEIAKDPVFVHQQPVASWPIELRTEGPVCHRSEENEHQPK